MSLKDFEFVSKLPMWLLRNVRFSFLSKSRWDHREVTFSSAVPEFEPGLIIATFPNINDPAFEKSL